MDTQVLDPLPHWLEFLLKSRKSSKSLESSEKISVTAMRSQEGHKKMRKSVYKTILDTLLIFTQ